MRLTIFALCCALASTTALAQGGPVIFGDFDCGGWVKANSPTSRTWLLGYLSGVNFKAATKSTDPLDKINSADQIFLWMDNYCRANPLKTVQAGANELYRELEKR